MILKERPIPEKLLVLRYLERRMELSEEVQAQLIHLEKGYAGELYWDSFITEGFPSPSYLLLNDLLLKNNGGQFFQMDSLLLRKKFMIFEVKNYDGEYLVENDRWYTLSKTEIQNPLIQLERTETAFRRLLQDLNIHIPVEAYVVFVNPEFTLFNAPINPSIILPSQLKRFLQKMKQETYETNDRDLTIAEKILSCHIEKSPFTQLPSYSYERLGRGIPCVCCGEFLYLLNQSSVQCDSCGVKESVETAIIRNVSEYQKLFPERLVTTKDIFEWCGGICSEKVVRRILKSSFVAKGANRHTFFV
jgi:hypothetical protein